jgi:hypothetical protein
MSLLAIAILDRLFSSAENHPSMISGGFFGENLR